MAEIEAGFRIWCQVNKGKLNVADLAMSLHNFGRTDIAHKLEKTFNIPSTKGPKEKTFDGFKEASIICEKRIPKNEVKPLFIRQFNMSERLIEDNSHFSREEMIHNLLQLWKQKEGENANVETILKYLKNQELVSIAEEIERLNKPKKSGKLNKRGKPLEVTEKPEQKNKAHPYNSNEETIPKSHDSGTTCPEKEVSKISQAHPYNTNEETIPKSHDSGTTYPEVISKIPGGTASTATGLQTQQDHPCNGNTGVRITQESIETIPKWHNSMEMLNSEETLDHASIGRQSGDGNDETEPPIFINETNKNDNETDRKNRKQKEKSFLSAETEQTNENKSPRPPAQLQIVAFASSFNESTTRNPQPTGKNRKQSNMSDHFEMKDFKSSEQSEVEKIKTTPT